MTGKTNVEHREPGLSLRKRKARKLRRERIYLLSLQELPPEKFERMFRRIRDGEIKLVGIKEEPKQRIKPLRLVPWK